jgi:GNAT superfamily N-acetyltransferase
MIIRNAKESDMDPVMQLIHQLALYEKAPDEVITSKDDLIKDGFGPNSVFDCIVAEENDEVIGFALFYEGYSTWKGRTLYLEDFLVSEQHRKKGIGEKLFNRVVEIAKERNVKRMDWQVLDWNKPAIDFYKKHNSEIEEGWLNGRIYF